MQDARNNPEKYPLDKNARAFSAEQQKIIDAAEEDPMCSCGDPSSMHVDGCEQCFNGDCGCREFEEKDSE